jgi:hypothetical protein
LVISNSHDAVESPKKHAASIKGSEITTPFAGAGKVSALAGVWWHPHNGYGSMIEQAAGFPLMIGFRVSCQMIAVDGARP